MFWFTDKNMKAAKDLVCGAGVFRPDNIYTDKHHYLSHSLSVAKLFVTNNARGTDNDPYYRALSQVLNAMIAMLDVKKKLS